MIPFNGGVENIRKPVDYEFSLVIVQIPLRSVVRDDLFWSVSQEDETGGSQLLNESYEYLSKCISSIREILSGNSAPVYYLNFAIPTINPWGRLIKKFSPTNIQYVISKLNERMESIVFKEDNSFVIDFDNILNTHGKRFFYEEMFGHFSHGGLRNVEREGSNGTRLESTPSETEYFQSQANVQIFDSVITEVIAGESVRLQQDQVKLIIFDLDDTLWRGVPAELISDLELNNSTSNQETNPYDVGELGYLSEGWPLGLVEAITYCKRRGILVSVVSKNEYEIVEQLFPLIFGERIKLTDFILPQINRKPKEENIGDLMSMLNLLPKNVVFIDDNPIEREAVVMTYPEIRVWGKYFLYTRWWLLTGSIFQVPYITNESSRRQEMTLSRLSNNIEAKGSYDRAQFLASLEIKCTISEVACTRSSEKRARAIELINKTNQWNMSGLKIDVGSMEKYGLEGGRVFGVQVRDRHNSYGAVGFLMIKNNFIDQFVLSCRVFGMGIESFFVRRCMQLLESDVLKYKFVETTWNSPLRHWLDKVAETPGVIHLDYLSSHETMSSIEEC